MLEAASPAAAPAARRPSSAAEGLFHAGGAASWPFEAPAAPPAAVAVESFRAEDVRTLMDMMSVSEHRAEQVLANSRDLNAAIEYLLAESG